VRAAGSAGATGAAMRGTSVTRRSISVRGYTRAPERSVSGDIEPTDASASVAA